MKSNLPDLEKEILNEVQPSRTEQHQLGTQTILSTIQILDTSGILDPHCALFILTWNFESEPFGVIGNRQAVLLRLEVEVALIFVVLG